MDWKEVFKGKKILVAEDDGMNQEMMKDIFENMGVDITQAYDGNQAVEKFGQGEFDIIIMDIRMPNKDGMQAIEEIRASGEKGKQVAIIALTANVLASEKDAILALGANDFLFKPINIEEFRKTLQKHIK